MPSDENIDTPELSDEEWRRRMFGEPCSDPECFCHTFVPSRPLTNDIEYVADDLEGSPEDKLRITMDGKPLKLTPRKESRWPPLPSSFKDAANGSKKSKGPPPQSRRARESICEGGPGGREG